MTNLHPTEIQAWAADEAAALVTRSADACSDTVRREVESVRKAFESAARSIEAALKAPPPPSQEIGGFVERLTAYVGLDTIRTQLQERDAANQRLQEMLTQTQTDLEAALSELKAARARAEAARGETVRARGETVRVQRQFEAAFDELRQEHLTAIDEQATTLTALPLDELLTVFRALGKVTTIPDALTTLVTGIAREFSRVALFDVQGSGLKGARQVGFDFQNDISKVVIARSRDSLLARAIKTGRLEALFLEPHSEAAGLLPFGGAPACALAIPIIVQGMIVGVIYADDADRAEFTPGAAQARAKYAELLQQHTVLVLLRLWVEQTARAKADRDRNASAEPKSAEPKSTVRTDAASLTELRMRAVRLAEELEREYTAGSEVGRTRPQCQQRLSEGLERARRLFAARIPPGSSDAAGLLALLEEHLAAVARARSQSNFGQDLAALVVRYRPVATTGPSPR